MNEDLYKRMEGVLRVLIDVECPRSSAQESIFAEAKKIISEFPKPADPDLLIARIIANEVEASRQTSLDDCMANYESGHYDDHKLVVAIRKGLARAGSAKPTPLKWPR